MKYKMQTDIPAPKERIHHKRLDDSLKAMQPGQSCLLDQLVAICLVQYGKYNGWVMRRKAEAGQVRVWRIS